MGGSFFSCPVKRNTKREVQIKKRFAVAMAPLPLLFIKAVMNQECVFQREEINHSRRPTSTSWTQLGKKVRIGRNGRKVRDRFCCVNDGGRVLGMNDD
jgi:hypothetical protein